MVASFRIHSLTNTGLQFNRGLKMGTELALCVLCMSLCVICIVFLQCSFEHVVDIVDVKETGSLELLSMPFINPVFTTVTASSSNNLSSLESTMWNVLFLLLSFS